ncbi:uncharacterized protein IUM83_12412 [Phytophthora cinnamomi]|uniref:uncharacterized protein n=1 Tax=Phytophthora cinnamomi TaxID=4785 RepID=UPI003559DA1B|nr:hypothetical protein IUM83_12412 [Phytophthora cinnamomi]
MLGMRRALGLRPQARLGILPAGRQLGPTAASRGFASSRSQAPSKWTRRLLTGVPTLPVLTFVLREPPQRNEQRRLMVLGDACARKGGMDQAIKYFTQSFEAVRGLLTPEATISGTCSYEESQGSGPHQRPLRHGIKLMDQMGKCYHHLWRHEPAEKLFKKVMRLYEKHHGEFSENAPSRSNDRGIA